tara:strand:+ start:3362 stop:4432 length:1071 start_codon:yes stop_codon:yes gene_type:complete
MLQYMEGPTGYMKRFADLTKDYFVYPKNEAAKNCKGVKILDRKKIQLSEIFRGKDETGIENNTARCNGTKFGDIENLIASFMKQILCYMPLPVVTVLKTPIIVDGIKYLYQLEMGYHRCMVFDKLGISEYWFDVIEFKNKGTRITWQGEKNDHPPCVKNSREDIIDQGKRLTSLSKKDGGIPNTYEDIQEWVDRTFVNRCKGTRTDYARLISKATKAAHSIRLWGDRDVQDEFYKKNNKIPGEGYRKNGEFDDKRNAYGHLIQKTNQHRGVHKIVMDWDKRDRPLDEEHYWIGYPKESSRTPAVMALFNDRQDQEKAVGGHLELYKAFIESGCSIRCEGHLPVLTDDEPAFKVIKI